MCEYNLIPYYRDLLIKSISTNSVAINNCVLKRWLHSLGLYLGFDGIRLFLVQDYCGEQKPVQIYGDKEHWRDFDITKMHKERTRYKKLFFVKIRHIRENGQFLVLGYLSFHTPNYVSQDLLNALDVLCMLYGNYIIKRMIASREEQVRNYLPRVFNIAISRTLPGTKILNLLGSFQHLIGFNMGVYCTMCGNIIVPEYVARNRGTVLMRQNKKWILSKEIINDLQCTTHKEIIYPLSVFSGLIARFFCT